MGGTTSLRGLAGELSRMDVSPPRTTGGAPKLQERPRGVSDEFVGQGASSRARGPLSD